MDAPPVVTKQPGLAMYPPLESGGPSNNGIGRLQGMTSVILKEERECIECCCGDKIPCGLWGLGCGPPKKRYYLGNLDDKETKQMILEEESDCCPRRCYNRCRGFTINAMDANTREVQFRIVRDFECCPCLCNCYAPCYGYYADICAKAFRVRIELPDGTAVGFVEQRSSCCGIEFEIMNGSQQVMYQFNTTVCDGCCSNPCCLSPVVLPSCCRWLTCCEPVVAKITTVDGIKSGSVSWNYPGCSDAFCCIKHQFHIECLLIY